MQSTSPNLVLEIGWQDPLLSVVGGVDLRAQKVSSTGSVFSACAYFLREVSPAVFYFLFSRIITLEMYSGIQRKVGNIFLVKCCFPFAQSIPDFRPSDYVNLGRQNLFYAFHDFLFSNTDVRGADKTNVLAAHVENLSNFYARRHRQLTSIAVDQSFVERDKDDRSPHVVSGCP